MKRLFNRIEMVDRVKFKLGWFTFYTKLVIKDSEFVIFSLVLKLVTDIVGKFLSVAK